NLLDALPGGAILSGIDRAALDRAIDSREMAGISARVCVVDGRIRGCAHGVDRCASWADVSLLVGVLAGSALLLDIGRSSPGQLSRVELRDVVVLGRRDPWRLAAYGCRHDLPAVSRVALKGDGQMARRSAIPVSRQDFVQPLSRSSAGRVERAILSASLYEPMDGTGSWRNGEPSIGLGRLPFRRTPQHSAQPPRKPRLAHCVAEGGDPTPWRGARARDAIAPNAQSTGRLKLSPTCFGVAASAQ